MAFHEKLQKILTIKEKEKERVMVEYQESVEEFEKVASKMYELLSQKEQVEEDRSKKLVAGLSMNYMKQIGTYIMRLEQSIHDYQVLLQNARTKMQGVEQRLVEKNMEVKKFEIIKDKRLELYINERKASDNRLMDEISIQQYMNKGN